MAKNTLNISLIVGIVFLFLSTTCLPVLASEGKADLVVERFQIRRYGENSYTVLVAVVRNIGNASTVGTIYLDYTVTRMYFGTIARSDAYKLNVGFGPGEGRKELFSALSRLHKIWFY